MPTFNDNEKEAFEVTFGNVEIARNQHILPFLKCSI